MTRVWTAALLLSTVGLIWAVNLQVSQGKEVKVKKFRSPGFSLGPGDVIDRYIPIDMPKGHIAVRSLDMNVVASDGTVVPLSETYLHHWVLIRYYLSEAENQDVNILTPAVPNNGVCNPFLVQYFGLGSEFRGTNTTVPAPYGIVLGNPADVPEGKKELWYANVHAIDTRGVDTLQGCTECFCDVYNVTHDGYGRPLPPGYEGGIFCCHDQTHCPLRSGFRGAPKRELFLEFVVTYVDFSDAVVPLRVYLLDVTDKRTSWDQPAACMVEYTVPKCAPGTKECIHTQEAVAFIPEGGYVVVSNAHMHAGGVAASVTKKNGEDICVSHPIYGHGTEAGDEKGFIVGMTSCYPDPHSIYIKPHEKLSLRVSYDNKDRHTGVMGILGLLIADGPPPTFERKETFSLKMALGMLLIVAGVLVVVYQYQNKPIRGGVRYKPISV